MEYGCIGERLTHSFSKELHSKIGSYIYDLKEIEKENLEDFIKSKAFKGINVTVPYKTCVIPFLNQIDERAEKIGAVNTVVNREGRLYGYNTDFDGMCELIKKANIEIKNKKVLILGTGGTSKTAKAVCESLEACKIVKVGRVKREDNITYDEAKKDCKDFEVIINTTPSGMYPNTEEMPIDLDTFAGLEGVVDVIYNPLRTRLVSEAKKRKIKAVGGLYMLVAQAVYAAEKFLNKEIDKSLIEKIYKEISAEKENIVLIGMPCSGKTTIGKILADKLSRNFVDTDDLIFEKFSKKPSEIIREKGEAEFRKMETEVIKEVSKISSSVIATGGGAVIKKENMENLKMNGRVYFIDRRIEDIEPSDDRPLSCDREKLLALYNQRYEKYISESDTVIPNVKEIEDTVNLILKEIKEEE